MTRHKRSTSLPDPTKRAPTQATSLTRVPTSLSPRSRGRGAWKKIAGPPGHTQSCPRKQFGTPPRPSERPPGSPARPGPPSLGSLSAEGGVPGKKIAGPPRTHTIGGVTPTKMCCAPPRPSKRPPRPPDWPTPPPSCTPRSRGGDPLKNSRDPQDTHNPGGDPLQNSAYVPASIHLGQLPPQAPPHWHAAQQRGNPWRKFCCTPSSGRSVTAGGRIPRAPAGSRA